jgi:hypothetical protein
MEDEQLAVATATNEAEEEAALESGFNGTDLEPVAEQDPTDTPVESPDAPPDQNAHEAEPAQPLTMDDLLAVISEMKQENQKVRDKTFGKIGELQQRIDAARTSASGLSPMARENLEGEFPELAAMLFDQTPVQAQQEPVQTYTPNYDLPPSVDVDAIKQEFELKLLTRDHRDWREVVNSKEFIGWTNSLPVEVAAELATSGDSDYVSEKISEFKAWSQAQAKKVEEDKKRQSRLDGAITPRGLPRAGTSNSYDDDEEVMMMKSFGRK